MIVIVDFDVLIIDTKLIPTDSQHMHGQRTNLVWKLTTEECHCMVGTHTTGPLLMSRIDIKGLVVPLMSLSLFSNPNPNPLILIRVEQYRKLYH